MPLSFYCYQIYGFVFIVVYIHTQALVAYVFHLLHSKKNILKVSWRLSSYFNRYPDMHTFDDLGQRRTGRDRRSTTKGLKTGVENRLVVRIDLQSQT